MEAYGLWNELHWAEWFAVISGAIYVPFEVVGAIRHPHWIRFALLNGNLVVVFYIVWILIENRRDRCGRSVRSRLQKREWHEAGAVDCVETLGQAGPGLATPKQRDADKAAHDAADRVP